ncbi:hypothetical protein [Psychrobacillus sp. FSL H8-0510]|uniref:hypothetical protein n=1 Tax=Psychrobacillus sp. FSL H8-0510 TaxID=2921394 RepID=UPI0030FC2A90
MEEIKEEITKRLAENAIHSSKNNKMFRIVDPRGRIYSLELGWQKISGKVYGHLFDENEVPIVIDVLRKHGYQSVWSEKDKTGSLFMLAVNSPFGNAKKMVQLLSVTIIFFILLFITLQTGLLEAFLKNINIPSD